MMSIMISYTTSLLQAISSFLSTEPMIYLFGTVIACFVVKILIQLISIK